MSKTISFFSGLAAFLTVLFIVGCTDMPNTSHAEMQDDYSIIAGPYITGQTTDGLILRFHTNRRCSPGIRYIDQSIASSSSRNIHRFAAANRAHAIPVKNIKSGAMNYCEILLDDINGPTLSLRPAPLTGAAVTIGFMGGGKRHPYNVSLSDQVLAKYDVNACILTGAMTPDNSDIETWARFFFNPLHNTARRAPFYFIPNSSESIPPKYFPDHEDKTRQWIRDIGCVRLIALDAHALKDKRNITEMMAWLTESLTARPSTARWTVVMFSEPLLGARHINIRAMEILGSILEDARVNLVISGGAPYYTRSLPVGDSDWPLYYIVTSGLGEKSRMHVGREYSAVYGTIAHVGILEADESMLEWKAVAVDGRVLDDVRIAPDGIAQNGEPSINKRDIVTAALAVQTLQKEILAVTRQACRAVTDPERAQTLTFTLSNPSTRIFSGELSWNVPENSKWKIEPVSAPFRLKPGEMAEARFQIAPAREFGAAPTFRIDADGIGYARQDLLLSKRKTITIPYVAEKVNVDGSFNEPFWKNSAELKDFEVAGSGVTPGRVMHSRLAYNDDGLLVALRCEAKAPRIMKVRANSHDGEISRDESVEIYLDPSRRGLDFFRFAVNVQGVTLEESGRLGLQWSPPWTQAIGYSKKYYDVEMLIPYHSLGVHGRPIPGTRWGLNAVRNDSQDKKPAQRNGPAEILQWAQTFGSNTRSGCYGIISFGAPGASATGKATAAPAKRAKPKPAPQPLPEPEPDE